MYVIIGLETLKDIDGGRIRESICVAAGPCTSGATGLTAIDAIIR